MSRRRERVAPAHVYVKRPAVQVSPDGTARVIHRPACRCGWEASQPYADADVARAAWDQHREAARA
jgi:spore germination cell wall hydrolase CwlJ-like protein